jgi:hypothetical protein
MSKTDPDPRLTDALPTGRDTVPISRARRHLAASLVDGTTCPVCGQHAQLYRRKLHAAMARDLVRLYRAVDGEREYAHVPTLGIRGGDFAKLAHFGLISAKPERRTDGGHAGSWRLTRDGVAFVEGRARVPGYVLIYDGVKIGYDGDEVGIDTVLGDAFDLRDVAAGPLPDDDAAEGRALAEIDAINAEHGRGPVADAIIAGEQPPAGAAEAAA